MTILAAQSTGVVVSSGAASAASGVLSGVFSGWDAAFGILFLLLVLLLAVALNRNRLVIGIVSVYVAHGIVLLLSQPLYPRASQWLLGPGRAVGAFLTLAVITGSVLGSSALTAAVRKRGDAKFSFRFVYAFAFLGMLVSAMLGRLPAEGFEVFSPLFWRLMGSPGAQVVWLLMPLIVMTLWRRRRGQDA